MAKRLLLIGDPHYKASNLEMMGRACQEILDIIDERKSELCIVLGDTLDTHERIFMRAQAQAIDWLRAIAKKCPLIVLIGNHDRETNQDFQSPVHPFVGLKGTPNITIVDTAIWDRENEFIAVPYVPNGRFREALETVGYTPDTTREEHTRFLFAHQEFKNYKMGVQISTKGDVWSPELPQIFSGHIHEYQVLPGVIYVGTFHQQNYGEDTDKAIMLVTIHDEFEPVVGDSKVKRPKFTLERIRLKSVPLRATVHMTLAELPNFADKIPPDCMVKVIIHLDATESQGLPGNPYYQAMKNLVDKIVVKVDSNKASIAENMVKDMKDQGRLEVEPGSDRKLYTIEEIVRGMLKDDEYVLNLFNTEIMS